MQYSREIPVLFFVSSASVKANGEWWLNEHQKQLEDLEKGKLVVLDGPHYLHRRAAKEMKAEIVRFFNP